MSRRDISDLWKVFEGVRLKPGGDTEAAILELYMLGVQDGTASRRRKRADRSQPKSERMQATAAQALPFVRRIAKWKELSPDRLLNGRDSIIAKERQEAYYVLRELPGRPFSYPVIALVFGKKDHSAVISGCKKVEARVAGDPELGARLRNLTRRVGAAA